MIKRFKVDVPDIPLAPKTTEKMIEEIRKEEKTEKMELEVVSGGDIKIIPINLSLSVNAPIDTVEEINTVYTLTRNIMLQLIQKSKPGKPHAQLLGYIKESREQIQIIHKMTSAVQNEAQLEKLKIVRAMIESNPDFGEDMKLQFLKSMRNKQKALE